MQLWQAVFRVMAAVSPWAGILRLEEATLVKSGNLCADQRRRLHSIGRRFELLALIIAGWPIALPNLLNPVAAQGFRCGAGFAEGAQAEGIVALGQTAAGFVGHQRTMIKRGRGQAEGAIKQ